MNAEQRAAEAQRQAMHARQELRKLADTTDFDKMIADLNDSCGVVGGIFELTLNQRQALRDLTEEVRRICRLVQDERG